MSPSRSRAKTCGHFTVLQEKKDTRTFQYSGKRDVEHESRASGAEGRKVLVEKGGLQILTKISEKCWHADREIPLSTTLEGVGYVLWGSDGPKKIEENHWRIASKQVPAC